MKLLKGVLTLVVALAAYLGLASCMTLFDGTIPTDQRAPEASLRPASEPLKVVVWNIGYAGLGEESDFRADGGKMLRPPGKPVVQKNLDGIRSTLSTFDADIMLMQEVAGPGLLTRGVDVHRGVVDALPDYAAFASFDVKSRLFPAPLRLRHGLLTLTRVDAGGPEIVRITEEPGAMMGIIKRRFHVQVTELDADGTPWTFINVHLSAFDEGANTRQEQLRDVLALAKSHYEQGRRVVVGGDWNMRLTETSFPNTTEEEFLFWLYDFPADRLEPGWTLGFDPATPTVRTNERPYLAGENYTTIIDGVLVSPNVEIVSARTRDTGFAFTDHQPVEFEFRSKPAAD